MKTPIRHELVLKHIGDLKFYELKPTEAYLSLYESYIAVRNTMDINNSMIFLRENPFMVECAFDISQFMSMQGNFKECNAVLENILQFYEDSIGPILMTLLEEDQISCALVFNQWSKVFFDTLLLFINILNKKGCYKAAYEYNKVLPLFSFFTA